ncbi:amino acid ABC transporter permease [Antarcticirhabdus aurantiaca]|uniref:Amino acid ABC transporter permease n=1 Tax=Antarcticirhabdus aurantiaca TaxID=2606717 RepID=A0ACD4NY62_9HYPH|nr:amino acid ABC transporter permease [Antarcticirhabdus aurantiaca]WAJ31548.1 amino acid ABC transporter permease [Jeongeuplla avenae]
MPSGAPSAPPPAGRRPAIVPPWGLVLIIGGLAGAGLILADASLRQIATTLSRGLLVTILVALGAYVGAVLLGLLVALAGRSRSRVLSNAARVYVEVVRGVPVLVLLFWIAFVGAPLLVEGANLLLSPLVSAGWAREILVRDVSLLARAVIALVIAYSAFIAEIVRAGIEAVGRGQVEAAEALGLRRWPVMRLVVLPQAIRTVMPALGNEFVAMVKDSSLVSVLGVADITQIAKVTAAGNFRFFETYTVLAYFYLLMTVSLSLALRRLERRLSSRGAGARPGGQIERVPGV